MLPVDKLGRFVLTAKSFMTSGLQPIEGHTWLNKSSVHETDEI